MTSALRRHQRQVLANVLLDLLAIAVCLFAFYSSVLPPHLRIGLGGFAAWRIMRDLGTRAFILSLLWLVVSVLHDGGVLK